MKASTVYSQKASGRDLIRQNSCFISICDLQAYTLFDMSLATDLYQRSSLDGNNFAPAMQVASLGSDCNSMRNHAGRKPQKLHRKSSPHITPPKRIPPDHQPTSVNQFHASTPTTSHSRQHRDLHIPLKPKLNRIPCCNKVTQPVGGVRLLPRRSNPRPSHASFRSHY